MFGSEYWPENTGEFHREGNYDTKEVGFGLHQSSDLSKGFGSADSLRASRGIWMLSDILVSEGSLYYSQHREN